MKYVISWRRKRHGSTAAYEAAQAEVRGMLDRWTGPGDVRIHQLVVRAGGTGGYAVFETDDAAMVLEAANAFSGFNFQIDPVLDVDVALAASGRALEWHEPAV